MAKVLILNVKIISRYTLRCSSYNGHSNFPKFLQDLGLHGSGHVGGQLMSSSSFCHTMYRTLSYTKGNFLRSLVTANTTYTTFDVVYTKIMLYSQQALVSQSDLSCLSRNTDVYVVYPQPHAVYAQTRVVPPQIQLCIQEHMLGTCRHNMF